MPSCWTGSPSTGTSSPCGYRVWSPDGGQPVISLRAHAISLAAVFLALALGVALGSGLLSNTLLSGLRDDKHELQNQINTLTDQKNAINEKLNAADEFDAQMSPRILRDA